MSTKLEEKLKISQEDTECSRKKYLIYDLDYLSYADCNLGCQLHGFSSGLLCATEHVRHYSVIKYYKDQFETYFNFFKHVCEINDEINIDGKLGFTFNDNFPITGNKKLIKYKFSEYSGRNAQSCLSKELLNQMKSLNFITEPYAWLMGRVFKYMLKTNGLIDSLFEEHVRELKIDFDQPLVG